MPVSLKLAFTALLLPFSSLLCPSLPFPAHPFPSLPFASRLRSDFAAKITSSMRIQTCQFSLTKGALIKRTLWILRIYFFLYAKKFDKKLGLINQPTATNGLIEVFPICCLCPFRAWQSWLWIKDLDFSLPLQLSYIKNKHCEVLVSCSDWVDLIELHDAICCQKLS